MKSQRTFLVTATCYTIRSNSQSHNVVLICSKSNFNYTIRLHFTILSIDDITLMRNYKFIFVIAHLDGREISRRSCGRSCGHARLLLGESGSNIASYLAAR